MFTNSMNEWEEKILAPYVKGLRIFISRLDENILSNLPLHTYEQRLTENIRRTQFYGNSAELRAERSEIICQLNRLAYRMLGISFNELCGITNESKNQNEILYSARIEHKGWHKNVQISETYEDKLAKCLAITKKQDYDEAQHLYWHLSDYIGTRELWKDCSLLSDHLLKLSSEENDLKTKGIILISGKVWPLLSLQLLPNAKALLVEALGYFQAAGAKNEISTFYKYMAAVEEAAGNFDAAVAFYREALERTSNIDAAHRTNLKMMFAEIKAEDVKSKSRVVALKLLRKEFKILDSYREGMVLIELAKSLHALKSSEAIEIAQRAFFLLSDEVMMPSRAQKAKNVLDIITQGKIGS